MKKISIVTPCFNEQENIVELYGKVKLEMQKYSQFYLYEHIFIDNSSHDQTCTIIKQIIEKDPQVKLIINTRNFGHIRSPYYGLLQSSGDATILLVSDLQDPPEMITELIKKWQEGYPIVAACKIRTQESPVKAAARRAYYKLLNLVSDVQMIPNFTGFALYDKKVIDQLKKLNDPYPFLRGLICELGFDTALVSYTQPNRKRGQSKNNWYTLYDIGILGLTSHSKKLLRIITIIGFIFSVLSLLVSIFYFVYKVIYWNSFSLGLAPLVLGLFFFSSLQLTFLGIVSEYIGNIYIKSMNRPLVIEKERVNF